MRLPLCAERASLGETRLWRQAITVAKAKRDLNQSKAGLQAAIARRWILGRALLT